MNHYNMVKNLQRQMLSLILFLTLYGTTYSHSPYSAHQIFNTSLQVIVRNELGNPESGVKVRLFKTKEDYEKLQNQATATLTSDEKGKVTFKNLDAAVYFINAEKESANNFGAGEQTVPLEGNKLNKLTIVISE